MSSPPENTFPPLAPRVVVIGGATATGKSAAGLTLATTLDGEILSADALAVYRGMDIGTAKPSAADRASIPHHLVDLVDPDDEFSITQYLRQAHRCVAQIEARGKVPIFVGGTPLYLKAILRGFDPGPPPDPDFRGAVMRDVETHGAAALHQRLAQVDPLAAHRIDPGDVRRMIRALEVSYLTGQPLSHRQTQFESAAPSELPNAIWLRWPREQLHRRINRRTEAMFEAGLVAEVESLRNRFGTLSRTAASAVGYKEVWQRLDSQSPPSDDPEAWEACRDEVATHTRQLARRQETWFRSLAEMRPLDIHGEDHAESTLRDWIATGISRAPATSHSSAG